MLYVYEDYGLGGETIVNHNKTEVQVQKMSAQNPMRLYVLTGRDFYATRFDGAWVNGQRLDVPVDVFPERSLNVKLTMVKAMALKIRQERMTYKVTSVDGYNLIARVYDPSLGMGREPDLCYKAADGNWYILSLIAPMLKNLTVTEIDNDWPFIGKDSVIEILRYISEHPEAGEWQDDEENRLREMQSEIESLSSDLVKVTVERDQLAEKCHRLELENMHLRSLAGI